MSASKMSANKMPAKISDVLRNHVKEKLARGEVVASMTVRLIRGIEIARIAKTAGFDSLYVDMEHSSFSLETMGQICIAALEVGITPFVRVPGLADVQRILDAGALGIIAPHVSSAAEARDYVGRQNIRRSASAPMPATCPICNIVRSRPPRPMRRSTPPPWSSCSSRARQRSTTPTPSWRSTASTWC